MFLISLLIVCPSKNSCRNFPSGSKKAPPREAHHPTLYTQVAVDKAAKRWPVCSDFPSLGSLSALHHTASPLTPLSNSANRRNKEQLNRAVYFRFPTWLQPSSNELPPFLQQFSQPGCGYRYFPLPGYNPFTLAPYCGYSFQGPTPTEHTTLTFLSFKTYPNIRRSLILLL